RRRSLRDQTTPPGTSIPLIRKTCLPRGMLKGRRPLRLATPEKIPAAAKEDLVRLQRSTSRNSLFEYGCPECDHAPHCLVRWCRSLREGAGVRLGDTRDAGDAGVQPRT